MRLLSGLFFLLAALFRRPLLWWVSRHVAPAGLPGALALDPARPVCYVLSGDSITDQFVLEEACREQGLPVPRLYPHDLPKPGRASCVALPKLEGKGMQRRYGNPVEIRRLVAQAIADREYDVQLIPVSIFWGRNPKQETSLLKIIFSDSLRAGALRKLFIIMVNGRNTLVNFGQPLAFQAFVSDNLEPQAATRKLVRVLRVHFRRQRTATLGPSLSQRSQVVATVLGMPEVRAAIAEEAAAESISPELAWQRARGYAEEIAADYNNAAINFMFRLLSWVWNRIYNGIEVFHFERLRAVAQDHGVIYLPAHRSHMDYLLVSYVLYLQGLAPPHVAAGINLNFWPVGGLLRRCGAFYLRRKFAGNRLYTVVFRCYVDVLLARGYAIQFFPEGGRSRTGRLLQPKTGLLSMVLHSYLRNADKRVVVVPVYLGYDRVMEVNSYFKELRGSEGKKNESLAGLIRASRVVRMAFGKPYISFGEPLSLSDYLDGRQPGWRDEIRRADPAERPDWLNPAVTALADEVMRRINSAAVLNPAGLVTTALLASPQKALGEDELCEQIEEFAAILREQPYSADVRVPEQDGRSMLADVEPMARLTRIRHPWGDLLAADGRQAVLLTYYRNNVLHLLALPSLIASFFLEREWMTEDVLVTSCRELYPYLRGELFLRWEPDAVERPIRGLIDSFVARGMLLRDPAQGRLLRPAVTTPEFGTLAGLGQIMRETLERYGMTAVLLAENMGRGYIERSEFEQQCHLMAQRMAVLSGRNAPEFFDKSLFSGTIDTLKEQGLLRPDPELGDRRLQLDPQVQPMAQRALHLLSVEVQLRIRRLQSRPRPEPVAAADAAAS